MKTRLGFLVAAAGLSSLVAAQAARAATVTFDGANDLANNFAINVRTGTAATAGYPGFVAVASGGVNNTGAVDVTAGPSGTLDATAVFTPQGFNPQNGTITINQFVKVQATPRSATGTCSPSTSTAPRPPTRSPSTRPSRISEPTA